MNAFPAASLLASIIFGVFACATVAGALVAVLTTRVIRSVCGLALCCVGIAGLYYYLNSPFLALMELLIYVGAVCVTIVFAVMLAEPDEPPTHETGGGAFLWRGIALVVSGAVFVAITRLSVTQPWSAPLKRLTDGSVPAIGRSLLTTYSLAFELISLVLLVAILGALVIARAGRIRS